MYRLFLFLLIALLNLSITRPGLSSFNRLDSFIKRPEYVRLQRQKFIPHQHLKVPLAIAQIAHALNKNAATQLVKLLHKYLPETKQEKKARILAGATTTAEDKDKEKVGYISFRIPIYWALIRYL
jgi:hypothetical protein